VLFGSVASSLPHVKSGRLKALATTGARHVGEAFDAETRIVLGDTDEANETRPGSVRLPLRERDRQVGTLDVRLRHRRHLTTDLLPPPLLPAPGASRRARRGLPRRETTS